ncbi:MAG: hypothetical protein L6Q66_06435 [Bacteroidia bacterium]|nr:hypothetical protein [Bacteroidia bacterium]
MDYILLPFKSIGILSLNSSLKDVENLIGKNYELLTFDFIESKQVYYSEISIKLTLDRFDKVDGIFLYSENPSIHRLLYNSLSLFEANYKQIIAFFENEIKIENSDSIFYPNLGITFYFINGKKNNELPEEIGIINKESVDFFLKNFNTQ